MVQDYTQKKYVYGLYVMLSELWKTESIMLQSHCSHQTSNKWLLFLPKIRICIWCFGMFSLITNKQAFLVYMRKQSLSMIKSYNFTLYPFSHFSALDIEYEISLHHYVWILIIWTLNLIFAEGFGTRHYENYGSHLPCHAFTHANITDVPPLWVLNTDIYRCRTVS